MRYPVLGAIVIAVLAGCGGSDAQEGESRRSDQFVRQVDALCKDTNPQLAEITTALTQARDAARAGRVSLPRTFEAFAILLRRAGAIGERLETRLRAIDVPSGERAFHDSLLESVEASSSNLRQQVKAAEAQDASRLRDLSVKGSVLNASGKGLVRGHGGFRHCGRAQSP